MKMSIRQGIRTKTAALLTAAALFGSALAGCGSGSAELFTGSTEEDGREPDTEIEIDMDDALASLMDFSLTFMREAVSRSDDENLVLSPASAYLALLLLACGSSGETAEELSDALCVPRDEWAAYGHAVQEWIIRNEGGTRVNNADSVWFDDGAGYEAKQEYLDTVREYLDSQVYRADLSAESTTNDINSWVSDATEGMIEQLRSEPYDEDVRAALLNALSFEAEWQVKFDAESTWADTFTAADGGEIQTDFMHDSGCHRYYYNGDGVESAALPYSGGNMAFIAARPTDGRTPEDMVRAMTPELLRSMADMDRDTTCMNLSLPRFDVDHRQELNDVFSVIGLEGMTSDSGADLSNMFNTDSAAYMDVDAAQAVRVRVDEDGTKAAAVTELSASESALPADDPIELSFDSPFVYMIVDTETAIPLFMGVMNKPGTRD